MEDMRPPMGPSSPWVGVIRTRLPVDVCIRCDGLTCTLCDETGGSAAKAEEDIVSKAATAASVLFMETLLSCRNSIDVRCVVRDCNGASQQIANKSASHFVFIL